MSYSFYYNLMYITIIVASLLRVKLMSKNYYYIYNLYITHVTLFESFTVDLIQSGFAQLKENFK